VSPGYPVAVSRFRFQSSPHGDHESWFRIGTLEVTTTLFVTILSCAGFVLYALSPAFMEGMALFPRDVTHGGQVWRIVTWPVANPPTFWSAVTIFFFWYFGQHLERDNLDRNRFAKYLGVLTLVLAALAILMSLAFSSLFPVLYGLESIELIVVLLFIAENRHVRFFFNIPGWLIGAVLVVLPVLAMIGNRDWLGLLHFLLGLVLASLLATWVGLLQDYSFIPRLDRSSRPRRPRPAPRSRGQMGTVTQGPWLSSGGVGSDQARLDALLDKISEGGMESLSVKERKELLELRRRLRGE
jgi:hypothetical protein